MLHRRASELWQPCGFLLRTLLQRSGAAEAGPAAALGGQQAWWQIARVPSPPCSAMHASMASSSQPPQQQRPDAPQAAQQQPESRGRGGAGPADVASSSAAAPSPALGDGPPGSRGAGGRGRRRGGKEVPAPTGRVVTTTAPWPFIDPTRPMILPEYLHPSNTAEKARPLELKVALQQVKDNSKQRVEGTERDLKSGRRRSQIPFDETVELIANLAVNTRKADQIVRGMVNLPHGTGKPVTVCVFAKGPDAEAAKEAGADLIGDEALIQAIIDSEGKAVTFDKLIATPEFMKPLAKAGRVLGPRGLMPNVKLGTLTSEVADAVREMRRGRVDFRVDREGIIHAAVGKVSFPVEHLRLNVGTLVAALLDLRPASIPGTGSQGYIKKLFVKSTMTASVPVAIEPTAGYAEWLLEKAKVETVGNETEQETAEREALEAAAQAAEKAAKRAAKKPAKALAEASSSLPGLAPA